MAAAETSFIMDLLKDGIISGAVIYVTKMFLDYLKNQSSRCNESLEKLSVSIASHTIALISHLDNCQQTKRNKAGVTEKGE